MSAAVIVFVVLIVVILVTIYINKEAYCSCAGVKTLTDRPVYYIYRPTGDVSDYASPCSGPSQFNRVTDSPAALYQLQNLGWKSTTGLDTPDFRCNSGSVPLLSIKPPPQGGCVDTYPVVALKSNSSPVPYAQDYGTPGCNIQTVATPINLATKSCCKKSRCDTSMGIM